MKKLFLLSILLAVIIVSGCSERHTGTEESIVSEKIINCENKCSFSSRVCFENEVRECEDVNGDGCVEEVFVNSCLWNEKCSEGRCIINTECKDGSCSQQAGYASSLQQTNYISYPSGYCGNSICESTESCQICYQDCGSCIRGNLSNGRSCDLDVDCISGFCVNEMCRSSSTYCGDDSCDGQENCSSCSHDCGKCSTFSVDESYSSSSEKILKSSYNRFNLVEAGNPYSSITIPLTFNESAEDVTFSYVCIGIEGTSFSASSRTDTINGPDMWMSINQSNISLRAHFGSGTANPFTLSNGKEYGTHIDSIGRGTARIIVFIWSFPEHTTTISCKFTVSSRSPSFVGYSTIEFYHNQ